MEKMQEPYTYRTSNKIDIKDLDGEKLSKTALRARCIVQNHLQICGNHLTVFVEYAESIILLYKNT
jgi:hypothetical protein